MGADRSARFFDTSTSSGTWRVPQLLGLELELVICRRGWTASPLVVHPPPSSALRVVLDSYSIPGFRITWEATADPPFSADLTMAYLWGRNTVSFNSDDGEVVTMHGRALTIWRHEPDGEWRCAVDIWNDEA